MSWLDNAIRKLIIILIISLLPSTSYVVCHIFLTLDSSSTFSVWKYIALFYSGESESGKTSLTAKLQGVEDPKKGAALEYHYIDVKDEYRDGENYIAIL